MKNSQSMISRMLQYKRKKKKNIRRSMVLSLMIILGVVSFIITPAITMEGTPKNISNISVDKKENKLAAMDTVGQRGSIPLNENQYIQPKGSLKGGYIKKGYTWNYASDHGTSKIEGLFNGEATDDGKVLVDKSVIYGKDDYGAFKKYEEGTFGVAMSALAQQYNVYHGETEDVPVDVVFVLDTSGSVIKNKVGGITRAEAMVNAVNPAIKEIMNSNPNNRIGIVNFSSNSEILIGLDRYTTENSNSKYLTYSSSEIKTVEGGISNGRGESVVVSTKNQTIADNWQGTYTQTGIARANEMLQANKDVVYTNKEGYKVKRKPIVILLSDGEPTYCTSNYTDVFKGPHCGNGYSDLVDNNKGVLGYYTILSANYYKQQIAAHYERNSGFYTIGMGIKATGVETETSASVTGDDYKRAVLNPSKTNISNLYSSPATYNSTTGLQMCQLLDNNYSESYIKVLSSNIYSLGGYTSTNVLVKENPYKGSSYKYNDNAYFGDMSEEELKSTFLNIIKESVEKVKYGFLLEKNTMAKFTDPIGTGMEVKENPILRYNGKNYTSTSQSETTGGGSKIKTYTYSYTSKNENTSRVVKLDEIQVRIIVDEKGKSTVNMDIPDTCMPVYSYCSDKEAYFEELPIRLIYQVGIKEDAYAAIAKGDVFYTNGWNAETAKVTLNPVKNNPYYMIDGGYKDETIAKKQNATGTSNNSSSYGKKENTIAISLGNNGKLTVGEEKTSINIDVVKKWEEADGTAITDTANMPVVLVSLYRKAKVEGAAPEYITQVKLNKSNDWKFTFTNMPYVNDENQPLEYYAEEVLVDGYTCIKSGSVMMGDGVITITNRKMPASGSIILKKKWQNYFGNPIDNTSSFPDIKAELWRKVEHTKVNPVKFTVIYGDNSKEIQVKPGSNVTFKIKAVYKFNWAFYSHIYKDGKLTEDSLDGDDYFSKTRSTALQTITANKDMSVNYTSVGDYSWIHAEHFELLELKYEKPGVEDGEVPTDELYEETHLNHSNNWQRVWENLPVTEEKNGGTYNYKYYVKEISSIPGYITEYNKENTEGIQGGELQIINRSKNTMHIIPETGGSGTITCFMVSIVIMLLALAGFMYIKILRGGGRTFNIEKAFHKRVK